VFVRDSSGGANVRNAEPRRSVSHKDFHREGKIIVFENYGTYFLLRTASEGTEGTKTKVVATTSTSTADTDSWTKLRRVHHHQREHVSACLGSAALRGVYDADSILPLTRGD
jgi:hypothetical protein